MILCPLARAAILRQSTAAPVAVCRFAPIPAGPPFLSYQHDHCSLGSVILAHLAAFAPC